MKTFITRTLLILALVASVIGFVSSMIGGDNIGAGAAAVAGVFLVVLICEV